MPAIYSLGYMTYELPVKHSVWEQLDKHESWVNLIICWITWIIIIVLITVSTILFFVYLIVLSSCGCIRIIKQDFRNSTTWVFRSFGEFLLGSRRHMVVHNYNYLDNKECHDPDYDNANNDIFM